MAITVTTTPDTISVPYGKSIKWVATSNDANIRRMIADIYIDASYRTTITKDPDIGTSNQFTFDVASRVRKYLMNDFQTTYNSTAVVNCSNSCKAVSVRLFEVTLSGGVFVTTWAENGAGTGYTSVTAINVGLTALQSGEDFTEYTQNNSSKKFLKYFTSPQKYKRGTDFQLDFYADATVARILKQYDIDNNLLDTDTSGNVSISSKKGCVKVSAADILSNTKYFTIQLQNDVGAEYSELFQFNIIEDCNDDSKVIYWRNTLGGYEHYHFNGVVSSQTKTSYTTFEQQLSDSYNSYDRGETALSFENEDYYECSTTAVSRAEIEALLQLIKQPIDVYVYESGEYKGIIIDTDSSQAEWLNTFSPIMTFKIVYRYSNKTFLQHG